MQDLHRVQYKFRHLKCLLHHRMDWVAVIQMTWVLLHQRLDTMRLEFVAKMLYYSFHCLLHFRFRQNDAVMLNDDAKSISFN